MNQPDIELLDIAQYVRHYDVTSEEAFRTARLCLMDSLGCAVLALRFAECAKMLGPVVPGTVVPKGARVPGTDFELDPVTAAFNIGTAVRWLDFNDTWLAAEWGHPSDNLGAILGIADWLSRTRRALVMRDVLTAMIKAHEIQGVMALENSFNARGLDHVILVKLASAAVAAGLLGCDEARIADAVSQVWCDLGPLRTYRHAPNTGSRKSWAAGGATARGAFLALQTKRGEMGYPTALSAPGWGFYDRMWNGDRFRFQRAYGSYVMENILFKVSFPAEFHAQTAVEAAFALHDQVAHRIASIQRVEITTHEAAIKIIDKTGPLHNPADRDHCLQYMVAMGLIFGALTADDYEDERAQDARIDALRAKMVVAENAQFTRDYHDPHKRSIANTVQVFFNDGTSTEAITIDYPIGHRRRRDEAVPLLMKKFTQNLSTRFADHQIKKILHTFESPDFDTMPVCAFMDLFVVRSTTSGQ